MDARHLIPWDKLTAKEIETILVAGHDELRARALAEHDPAVLSDEVFLTAFDSKHLPCDPWIDAGLLICCGSLRAKFDGGHKCSFVVVDDDWVWSANHEHDEIRWIDDRSMTCVTVLVAQPGMQVSMIESRCDGGVHKRTSATSWRICRGSLEPIATPSRVPQDHRR